MYLHRGVETVKKYYLSRNKLMAIMYLSKESFTGLKKKDYLIIYYFATIYKLLGKTA